MGRLFAVSLFLFALNAWGLDDFSDVLLLGGQTSPVVKHLGTLSLRQPVLGLNSAETGRHLDGDALFEAPFSDIIDRPGHGLGPVFNHISCDKCHINDGRGVYPVNNLGDPWTKLANTGLFLRISVEDGKPRAFDAADNWGAPRDVPGFGNQLFQHGLTEVRPDSKGSGVADVFLKFEKSEFRYPDGTAVTLGKPVFEIRNAYDSKTDSRLYQSDVRTSPRMTPQMNGLGLIEAIREEDILALANRDLSAWGVSGRPNWVFDRRKEMNGNIYPVSIGRFGWKGSNPTVEQQTHGALHGDIGVTTELFPLESIAGTPLFEAYKQNWHPGVDLDMATANTLVFYAQTLVIPSRRDVMDPEVRRGGAAFTKVGCTNCHQPSFTTGAHPIPIFSNQLIYPFTDLLLHDMGEGLADNREDFHATGREWKTPPLWTMGVVKVVNLRARYLHDGRANSLEEAILWHGGEAEISRQKFAGLPADERAAVIRFLKSL